MILNTVYTNALIANSSQVPTWSFKIAIIMIICNLICIGIGRYAIQVRGLGPSVPLLGLEGFGLPELLATTSLGHITGAGVILGLSYINVLK
uniref:Photosystem I reaction center subunit PsaK n=2 Tax=Gelidium TaxID=2811 RepID=A0A411FSR3_9FLOR|nr:photosystem I subunit X [Gelidium coulteri]YP_009565254.1 photosystem I subunit X [Gelidium sinicola]QBA96205.1 photosystem I subunit X [Gelidium coulteri]QBA96605.1 photosystem I subunit X [Gelidium sinicola]